MKRIITIFLSLLVCSIAPFLKAPAQARLADDNYPLYLTNISFEYGFTTSGLGPYIGRPLAMGQDAANPDQVYAMTYGSGMFRSTNGGASWSPASVGIPNLTLQSLAVDPKNPNVLYTGAYGDQVFSYNGVYKSTNGGLSWSPTGEMANTWGGYRYTVPIVYALAIDPNNPNRLFAGTRMRELPTGYLGGGGVFRSENGGATWSPVNSGLPSIDLYVYDLLVDGARPGVVYAALHQHGLYRSDNYGSSWYPLNGTPYAGRAVAVDPFNSNTIFFGAMKKLGLNRSVNYGASWSKIGSDGWDVMVGGVSTDPRHQGRVFAGILSNNTDYLLMRSDDGGYSWNSTGDLDIWGRIAFSPDGQTDYVAVDFDGPYKSTDGGWNWFPSKQGFTGFSVTGMAAASSKPDNLYAALFGSGVYEYSIPQNAWYNISNGLGTPDILSLTMDPNNSAVLYATTRDGGVYRTTNGGGSWGALTGGYPAAPAAGSAESGGLTAPEPVSPFDNRPLPEPDALKDDADIEKADVSAAASGLASGKTLAVSPVSSNVVLVGTAGRGIYWLNSGTWTASNKKSGTVYSILFDKSTTGRALAGTDVVTGSLLISTDNGKTWTVNNASLPGRIVYSLAQNPANPLIFLAGTDFGVYQSTDGGATWMEIGLYGQAVKTVSILPRGVYLAGLDTAAYYSYAGSYDWKALPKALNNVGIQGILPAPAGQTEYFYTRLGGVIKVDVK